jgi:hypothetical protein
MASNVGRNDDFVLERIAAGKIRVDENGHVYGSGTKRIGCKVASGYRIVVVRCPVRKKAINLFEHRVVWLALYGKIPGTLEVNHKDGTRKDWNHPSNLELLTQSENMNHAYRTGLNRVRVGEESGNHKYTIATVKEIRERYANGERVFELAKAYEAVYGTISSIVHRKSYKYC